MKSSSSLSLFYDDSSSYFYYFSSRRLSYGLYFVDSYNLLPALGEFSCLNLTELKAKGVSDKFILPLIEFVSCSRFVSAISDKGVSIVGF